MSRFPKKERLKSKKIIDLLFRKGGRVHFYPVKIIYSVVESDDSPSVQAGFAVSKRQFNSAVKRNSLKRKMREAYRLHKEDLFQLCKSKNIQLALFVIYIGKERKKYSIIEKSLIDSLHKTMARLNAL